MEEAAEKERRLRERAEKDKVGGVLGGCSPGCCALMQPVACSREAAGCPSGRLAGGLQARLIAAVYLPACRGWLGNVLPEVTYRHFCPAHVRFTLGASTHTGAARAGGGAAPDPGGGGAAQAGGGGGAAGGEAAKPAAAVAQRRRHGEGAAVARLQAWQHMPCGLVSGKPCLGSALSRISGDPKPLPLPTSLTAPSAQAVAKGDAAAVAKKAAEEARAAQEAQVDALFASDEEDEDYNPEARQQPQPQSGAALAGECPWVGRCAEHTSLRSFSCLL